MKYLVFSVAFLTSMYGISTILLARRTAIVHNNDFLSLDICNICKGLSIILIMLGHIGNLFGTRVLTPLGSWGVGVFLFLSGYGLTCSVQKNGLNGFWKRRIKTAYLPYITAEVLGFVFCLGVNYQEKTLIKIVCDALLIKTVHPYGWYMQCLFLYYIIFFLAQKFFANKKPYLYAFIFLASGLMFLNFRELFKQQLFPFTMGVFVADHISQFRRKADSIWYGGTCIVLGLVCLFLRQISFVRESYWVVYNVIHAMQVAFLTMGTVFSVQFLCNNWKDIFTDVFLKIGLISYELYLYHGFVFGYIIRFEMSYCTISVFFLASFGVAMAIKYIRNAIRKDGFL